MPKKKKNNPAQAKKNENYRIERQRNIYRIVFIVISVLLALSMVLTSFVTY